MKRIKKIVDKMDFRKYIVVSLMLLLSVASSAQCSFRNTAFNSGEFLTYNLYFNWQFVWVKVGTASWYTVSSTYKGIPAYRASLMTRGNGKLDKYFVMRDTLLCYNTKDLAPLYYRKGAKEGKRYTVDEVFYSYPNGRVNIKQHYINNEGKHHWLTTNPKNCVYDMMSIFLRARSFNPTSWKKGYVVNFPLVDGSSTHSARIIYDGKTTIKADNNKKYRCLELSYYEYDDNKWRNIASFFVTDDNNHIPIRLDMRLKFGSAKAFLTTMKGIRQKITSQVK
ncbi:hypothetical protein HMPREF9296_0347 [Prevotella disiens FB035-09AN]|uniref:DUF3108 domain-containing protein n=1 Tax=Prevotella disiens FB035-09AN TaxID=866771 RepID=E1KPC0_9BACT|nr:hypothetical protein HMPREF9296_0347 [Prevotella disiens FB035-09AN]